MEALIRQIEKLLQIKITDMNGDRPKTEQELAIEEGKIFQELDRLYEEGFINLRDARDMKLALQAKYREFARQSQQKGQEKQSKEAVLAELRKKWEEIGSKSKTTQELTIEEGKFFQELDHLYEEGVINLRESREMKLALQEKYRELARKNQQQEKPEPKSAKEAVLEELRKKREDIDSKSKTEEGIDWLEEINQELRAMGFDIPVTEIEEPERVERVEPVEGHQRLF